MAKERHQRVRYVRGETKAKALINDVNFRKMTELSGDIYEAELSKRSITLDLPIILGYTILQYAKVRMLEFYYDCVDRYVDRADFEYIQMDTDSAYAALAGPSLESVVKPSLKEEFRRQVAGHCGQSPFEADANTWFPRECCRQDAMWDRRTPGLFKLEATGQEMIALSSKTYLLQRGDDFKMSCKGINKRSVLDPATMFRKALFDREIGSATNLGFRARNNTIYSYRQEKVGFGYFYCKRKLSEDGVSTEPLDIVLRPWPFEVEIIEPIHPLGMMHLCDVKKDDRTFRSLMHAYQYEMAAFHGKRGLSEAIVGAKTPSDAAKIGSRVQQSAPWYQRRDEVLTDLMRLKMEQSLSVRVWLTTLAGKPMAYIDRFSSYLGCGLNARVAEVTSPDQFPGQNKVVEIWKSLEVPRDDNPFDTD